jgi:hypothetical protein
MATETQTRTAWAPWIRDLDETLETCLAEVKHKGESKLQHPESLRLWKASPHHNLLKEQPGCCPPGLCPTSPPASHKPACQATAPLGPHNGAHQASPPQAHQTATLPPFHATCPPARVWPSQTAAHHPARLLSHSHSRPLPHKPTRSLLHQNSAPQTHQAAAHWPTIQSPHQTTITVVMGPCPPQEGSNTTRRQLQTCLGDTDKQGWMLKE